MKHTITTEELNAAIERFMAGEPVAHLEVEYDVDLYALRALEPQRDALKEISQGKYDCDYTNCSASKQAREAIELSKQGGTEDAGETT